MVWRLIFKGWRFRLKRILLALAAIVLGSSLIAALLGLYFNVDDKVGRELRTYGANINVSPKNGFIEETELSKIKQIFWKNNILGFAPYLKVVATLQGKPVIIVGTWKNHEVTIPNEPSIKTGIESVAPWWKIQGEWPQGEGIVLGNELARVYGIKTGDKVTIDYNGRSRVFVVSGILESGGPEEGQIIAPLETVQELADLNGKVNAVKISALTKPTDTFAQKDPKTMTAKEYETWYCSPYMASIIYQVNEVVTSGAANPIEQVVKAEDAFLKKVGLMVLLVTIVTFVASGLSIMTTATANMLERRTEIGIMKALGADNRQVVSVFLLEFILLGLAGGTLGYLVGIWLTKALSIAVFGSPMIPGIAIFPATLGSSVLVAIAGGTIPVLQASKVEPARVLHGE